MFLYDYSPMQQMGGRSQTDSVDVCTAPMADSASCGRPIYGSGSSGGGCILHSDDPSKPLSLVHQEINAVLHHPTSGVGADLTGIRVPVGELELLLGGIPGGLILTGAVLDCDLVLAKAGAGLSALQCARATFGGRLELRDFECSKAVFEDAAFLKPLTVLQVRLDSVTFFQAEFSGDVSFRNSNIRSIDVSCTCFRGGLRLDGCNVGQWSGDGINCDGRLVAIDCTFQKPARFGQSMFAARGAMDVTFSQGVNFASAGFPQGFSFANSKFGGIAVFRHACFGPGADEQQVKDAEAIADFRSCQFAQGADLTGVNRSSSQGLRLRAAKSNIVESPFWDVQWYRRAGRRVLQDELDPEEITESAEVVADAYAGLVKTFDDRRMYDHAEDFRWGELEMRRRPEHTLYAHRGLLWLYGKLSGYGSSYRRAAFWLGMLFLMFSGMYSLPAVGLRPAHPVASPTATTRTTAVPQWVKPFGAGVVHTVEVAAFNRRRQYEVSTPAGALIEAAQLFTFAGQVALFLFALRRRFRS